jgi:hypothetical protein
MAENWLAEEIPSGLTAEAAASTSNDLHQKNSHDDADFVTMGTGDEAELRRLLG